MVAAADGTEVGSKLSGVSLYGVYDMLMNILEFTSDRYKFLLCFKSRFWMGKSCWPEL